MTIILAKYLVTRDTAAEWTLKNPVLLDGEQGLETDTRLYKFGDGVTAWNALAYPPTVADAIDLVQALDSNDGTAALAANQGPVISSAVNAASGIAVAAASNATAALSAAGTATSAATAAGAAAAAAAVTANAASAAVATKATLQIGAIAASTSVAPSSTAVIDYVDAAVEGMEDAELISQSLTIPLDTPGNGKYMPEVTLTMNSALIVGSGPVPFGNCSFSFVGNGSATLTYGTFVNANDYAYDNTAGQQNIYSAVYIAGTPLLFGATGKLVDATAATLVSATVEDADATKIDLVWSEPMNATVSASSAFAVSAGHALTAHTYVDSTHTYLTTSTPFVSGETKTLAYTQPGSNKMQDLAGNLVANFSGTAITDNVTGGSLSVTAVSAAGHNLTTAGYSDWFKARGATAGSAVWKADTALIAMTLSNLPDGTNTAANESFSWDTNAGKDADGSGSVIASPSDEIVRRTPTDAGALAYHRFTATVVGDTGYKFLVILATYQDGGSSGKTTIRATLSSGATEAAVCNGAAGIENFAREFTVTNGNAETITVDIEQAAADNPNALFIAVVATTAGT